MEIDNSSKTFLENIFDGDNFQPSASIEKSFMQSFEGAINIEWLEYEEHLEAIFYKDKVEHIALFSKDGILQEYRKSLPEGYLPYNVRKPNAIQRSSAAIRLRGTLGLPGGHRERGSGPRRPNCSGYRSPS